MSAEFYVITLETFSLFLFALENSWELDSSQTLKVADVWLFSHYYSFNLVNFCSIYPVFHLFSVFLLHTWLDCFSCRGCAIIEIILLTGDWHKIMWQMFLQQLFCYSNIIFLTQCEDHHDLSLAYVYILCLGSWRWPFVCFYSALTDTVDCLWPQFTTPSVM